MENNYIKDNIEQNKGNNPNNMANNIVFPKSIYARKAEKIFAATTLLTNFLNDLEPIKWDIRRLSSNLVYLSNKISFSGSHSTNDLLNECRICINSLSSLMDSASLAGQISPMNANIISTELSSLLSLLEKDLGKISKNSGFKISKNFFEIPEQFLLKSGVDNSFEGEQTEENPDKNIKDKNNQRQIRSKELSIQNNLKPVPVIREYGSVAIKRNKRQSFIIQILKKKKDLTIKDISTIFHDCSEKTIQRELALLIDEGVVVREGERRWTRYSLALGL